MPAIRLSDGTKLRTGSHRRFVTFEVTDDSTVIVRKRTDSRETALSNHAANVRLGACRTVTVDFADLGTAHTGPSVLKDT